MEKDYALDQMEKLLFVRRQLKVHTSPTERVEALLQWHKPIHWFVARVIYREFYLREELGHKNRFTFDLTKALRGDDALVMVKHLTDRRLLSVAKKQRWYLTAISADELPQEEEYAYTPKAEDYLDI